MPRYRVKCPACGEAVNLSASGPCPKCGAQISAEAPARIRLYRMGNFVGVANAFGIYINEQPYGYIGNKETLTFPLPYGSYKMHIVCGMNRKCNDPVIELTPQDNDVCLKVHIKMGLFRNSFIIERADPSSMPE